jgi:FixJ family two-component response regulator
MIFTTTSVADGSWLDVIVLAEKSGVPSNVIVVAETSDVKLYLSTIEGGAFDFMVPPFERDPLGHVVRAAWLDVQRRRDALARLAEI